MHFGCPEGFSNPIADLLLGAPEDAIQRLYSGAHAGRLSFTSLVLAFLGYTIFCTCTPGLPLPTGSFIPAMFVGALVGKMFGKFLADTLHLPVAHSSTFAVVGSAAFLGAFTHQTLAIVVFLVECVDNISLISPLIITVAVAHFVTKYFSEHGFDEELVILKGVPYLDIKPPHGVDDVVTTAEKLLALQSQSSSSVLQANESPETLEKALRANPHITEFPVVSSQGACLGLANRSFLEAMLCAARSSSPNRVKEVEGKSPAENSSAAETLDGDSVCEEADVGSSGTVDAMLPVCRIMNPAPWTVLPSMPAVRLYPLFSRLGVSAACVISGQGEFHGVLTRQALLAAGHDLETSATSEDRSSRSRGPARESEESFV